MDSQRTTHAPVSGKKRMKEIDIIRGFALFGVLLVNVQCFNATFAASMTGQMGLTNPLQLAPGLDRVTAILISFFAEGKFYTMFSFLFGLGFTIFINRAEEKGLKSKSLFRRRMFALFVFGLINLTLVWWGDILHAYAIGGMILLLFKNKSVKSLKRWAFILLAVSIALSAVVFSTSPLALQEMSGDYAFVGADFVEQSFRVFTAGTYTEIFLYRLTSEIPFILSYLLFLIPKTMVMFLIGMIFGKMKVFEDKEKHIGFVDRTWRIVGLAGAVSLIMMLVSGYPVTGVGVLQNSMIYSFFYQTGTVAISMFYVTSLIKLLRTTRVARVLDPLRHVGRMALTNYLVQCAVCAFVFYGYGLGIMTQISIFEGVIFTVVFFIIQLGISRVWFRYYQFGPLEWIWRKFTYAGKSLAHQSGQQTA